MRLFLLLIISVSLLFVVSCKPDKQECHDPSNKDCDNYDPCFGQKPVKAEIILSQRAAAAGWDSLSKLYIDEQNVFSRTQIRFHCPLNGAKYTWTLGAETITSQTFERNFFSPVPFGTYSVKLVVEKTPNKQCFPGDDGVDTFIKTFQILPVCSLAMNGVFKGKWDNIIGDSALISLRVFDNQTYKDSCDYGVYRLTNLKGTKDTLATSDGVIANAEWVNYDEGSQILGNAKFKLYIETNKVVFDYYIGTKRYLFRGRKIAN